MQLSPALDAAPAASAASAASAAAHAAVPSAPPAIGAGSVAGALGSLALVVALIFALGWLARRLRGLRAARGGGELQLLGGVSIGSKERVVVLRVGGEHLVVGVAPGCVSLLHRYAGSAARAASGDDAPAANAVVIPFADKLRELLRRQGAA
ncbi:flagellar biosynthetic protein FliO [Solimonas soli]|uniref:flagellar biosynthetic protein FliO n=1 Tax=Solimonas soli TaxID=413479 RepID=UPI0004B8987C|nr:flagellar biosynthetic protein FliO [Solimonas soli]